MSWYKGLKGKILFDEPLSKRTALRVGHRARLWIEPYDIDDLKSLIKKTRLNNVEYLIIGLGSKLLLKKKNLPLVIHLASKNFRKISFIGNEVLVGAGVSLGQLIKAAARNGLGGIEFLSGIPASIGGALVMNTGVSWPVKRSIGDLVETVGVLDKRGNLTVLGKKDLRFGYRQSNLSRFIVVWAKLRLEEKTGLEMRKEITDFLNYRQRTQDLSYPCAGCTFRNPANYSAGRLIDLCGLKGKQIGDAAVSTKHANFIINKGRASADDVFGLMKLIQGQVRRRFKVYLKPEIQVI